MVVVFFVIILKITVFHDCLFIKALMALFRLIYLSGTSVPHEQLLFSSFNLLVGKIHNEKLRLMIKCDQTLPINESQLLKLV